MINADRITKDMPVKVVKLGSTRGMLIAPRHLEARKLGATGTMSGYATAATFGG